MSRHLIIAITTIFLAAMITSGTRAQEPASGTSSSSGAQSSPSSATPSRNSGNTSSPAPPAPKKVWTNDDVTDLRDNSEISTLGRTDTRSGNASDKSDAGLKTRDAKSYHDQIAKLEAQLTALDSQIAQLQDAIDGKATGDGKTSTRPTGVKGDDWRREEAELQNKHDDISARIDALRDQARHNGIPANALP
jgi:hypothetical protein